MTKPARPPAVSPSESTGARSTWIGLGIVAATVVATTAVLTSQKSRGLGVSQPPVIKTAASADVRFLADSWSLPPSLPPDDMLGFVYVEAGPLVMGNDKATDAMAFDNERWSPSVAQGTVDLPEFYIGRYEVTVAQFLTFAAATRHPLDAQMPREPSAQPVAFVSWPEALAYCRWLGTTLEASSQTPDGLRRRLREGWEFTLPTEAQWEKAARGGDGRRYPWGSEPRRDRANFAGTAVVPVGSMRCPECPYGLLDMSGNVWEWTRSPYQAYPFDPAAWGTPLEGDALWVMRGGSFADTAQNIRAATRGGADPGVRRDTIGFRVALSRSPRSRGEP